MASLVETRRDGGIAVIVVDNPPVNALNNAVRSALLAALEGAKADVSVAAVVLTCAGRTFVAGSDIAEFGTPPRFPTTPDVIAAIEAMGKPVIAALFGTPMGGGLELALGCHFRIAAPGTRLGLPEVKLGLIPGAGGTQRLPRLAGMEKALPMILSGDPIPAQEALACGIVDEIADGPPAEAGTAFARRVLAERRPLRLARDRDEKLAPLRTAPAKFDEIAALASKRARGPALAPSAALRSLRNAIDLPVADALAWERAKFLELVESEESKSQRHIFFAEREAARAPGLEGIKARDVGRVTVIGAGTMGGGIAMCFANIGVPVTIVETSQDALTRGLDTIAKNYRVSAQRGALSNEDVERRMAGISGVTDVAAAADADLVIEAAFEDMKVKTDLFSALDRIARRDAVLATNTSYLDVDAIARVTARPEAVLGMHFFSPANVMKLLEVVRAEKTSPQALATAIAVGRRIGKIPAVVGMCHGFVGNRMLRLRGIEAERVLLEGAMPQEIDAAMTQFGFAMGPLATSDLGGLDIGWRMRKAQGFTAPIADQLCELGRFGQKTGKGYYRYEPGSRTPHHDEVVEHLILATAHKLGVKRRPFDHKEIQERLIFPMINEGARLLAEGIAQRAGDIDVIWVYGYGFPAWRGGIMHYAGTAGLRYICERLDAFAAQTGDERHKPAPLLRERAAAGGTFS